MAIKFELMWAIINRQNNQCVRIFKFRNQALEWRAEAGYEDVWRVEKVKVNRIPKW